MEVDNIEIDLYNFNNYSDHNQYFSYRHDDYQITTKYISENSYSIIVRRLDKNEGWGDNLQVLVVYLDNNSKSIIDIGTSDSAEKEVTITLDFQIKESTKPINLLSTYNLIECPDPITISNSEFNTMFDTDIVRLPDDLYAFGLANGKIYMYTEKYIMYYETIRISKLIFTVALTFKQQYNKFYFLICIGDGYMELIYHNNRTKPKMVTSEDCIGHCAYGIQLNDDEYPIYHKNKYVIGQANNIGIPYTLDTVDRHYLYCDLYKPFRSFHKGVKFETKINKIVCGCRMERSYKYNFLKRRDIEIGQREYFFSDAVSKENVVCSPGWIHDYEMVNYKYILDIDGNSCTWDATAWKLNSGSVIFKTESRWRQWFYDDYLPWVHYVPINDDFSNLQEMYNWCEQNQDKCETIIKNAKQLFQKAYSFHGVIQHTIGLLDTLNNIVVN